MKELMEYRLNLMKRLEDSAAAFRDECLRVKDPYAPLDAEGWNVHQIAAHTRDVDKLVYGVRARRTAVEDNLEFPNFDGDAYMAAHYNSGEPLQELLDDFVENVRALVELLRALPAESWSRLSRHAMLGSNLTLQSWIEKDLAHIEEHLATVKNRNPA